MQARRISRENEGFYAALGPVFGSRIIERETHDRFYDDPDKIWYIVDQGAASVLNGVIRNFYAADDARAESIIAAMQADYPRLTGVAPRKYKKIFEKRGFRAKEYRKNFIEVLYEAD